MAGVKSPFNGEETMKKTVNLAGFITATALGIGAVAHQYGTSLREMCDGAVGSNLFSSFAESATGEDFSRPGKWVSLLYIDRHLVHEVTSPQAFEGLRLRPQGSRAEEDARRRRSQRSDHRSLQAESRSGKRRADRNAGRERREFGVEYFNEYDKRQGIVHVIGPEQGFTLPGTTIVCGDSHTSTHGAFGALAHGIGTSEVEHVLATQTLIQKKAKNMRVDRRRQAARRRHREGHHPRHHRRDRHRRRHRLRARICRRRHPRAVDGRPHDRLQHVDRRRRARRPDRAGREGLRIPEGPPESAEGRGLGQGVRYWETLRSDEGAHFDHEIRSTPPSCRRSSPGAPPRRRGLDHRPGAGSRPDRRRSKAAVEGARAGLYGPAAGTKITDIKLDRVFIGSCTNGRIEDLRAAAKGRRARPSMQRQCAMIVPGSGLVKEQAEAEGLDKISSRPASNGASRAARCALR
jgi:3-isopropylmalate/(R)-2-methylmalate dehydratase large subunit